MDLIVFGLLAVGLGYCVYRVGKQTGSRRGFGPGRIRRRR